MRLGSAGSRRPCAARTGSTVTYWCLALDDGERAWTFDVGRAAFGRFALRRPDPGPDRAALDAAARPGYWPARRETSCPGRRGGGRPQATGPGPVAGPAAGRRAPLRGRCRGCRDRPWPCSGRGPGRGRSPGHGGRRRGRAWLRRPDARHADPVRRGVRGHGNGVTVSLIITSGRVGEINARAARRSGRPLPGVGATAWLTTGAGRPWCRPAGRPSS